MFCPKCGKELSENASYCPKCGMKVESPMRSAGVPWQAVSAIVLAVVAIIGVVIAATTGLFPNASLQGKSSADAENVANQPSSAWVNGSSAAASGSSAGETVSDESTRAASQSSSETQSASGGQSQDEDSPAIAPAALSGTYAMAKNHTVEFQPDGSCIVQDNGVSWAGTYRYDAGAGSYKVTVNGLGGTVQTYTFTPQGDDLVLHQNGYDFLYEKQGGESPSARSTQEAESRDIITGTFIASGMSSQQDVSSITFGDDEVYIVGELFEKAGVGKGDSIGDKTWVFGIDENTKYGYRLYDGFHEQSQSDVASNWSAGNFPSITIEVVDGVVTLMSQSA